MANNASSSKLVYNFDSSLFSNLNITSNSCYPKLDMQLRIHSDIQIYDFSATEHFYPKASV